MKTFLRLVFLTIAVMSLSLTGWSQTCFTSDDMDAATRSALQAAGARYFDMVSRGDIAGLKQNSTPAVASNFAGIEETIKENQANLSGAHATARAPFELKAEGTAPLAKAEFLCGVFDANGQTKNSAEFNIPNLPPGTYGIVIMDVPTQKSGYTVAFVLQQMGTDWKIGGFFLRPTQVAGHDSNWFLERARTFKQKGQTHNAWLYFVQGRDLAMPVPFMYTQMTDKLYDETQSVKPTDFPVNGNPAELTAAAGKTYKLTTVFPLAVQDSLDLVVKYETASVADSGQTFQENMNVMRAVVTKFPELRDAFDGIVCRAVEPSGRDYGSLMPMKDIK